ncbi:hypothetical protein MMC31_005000 [Peltigera leucophlebia]|nr:hypothetical protein [Peltigera leucophlebia]
MWFAGIPALQQAGNQGGPPPSKHPGAARRNGSSHRPMPPTSKHSGAARRSRSPHHPMPSPSKHPGSARRSQSLHRNARKLSRIYATGNMERVGGKKHERLRTARKSAACPNPLDEEEKRNKKGECGCANNPVPCDRSPMSHSHTSPLTTGID